MRTKKLKDWDLEEEVEEGPIDLIDLISAFRYIEEHLTPGWRPLAWWKLSPVDLWDLEEEGWITYLKNKCTQLGKIYLITFTPKGTEMLSKVYGGGRKKAFFRE